MRYYLDTEFNGFGGDLLSLALVREDNFSLYLVYDFHGEYHPWVKENVVPILWNIPDKPYGIITSVDNINQGAVAIQHYLQHDNEPLIITDWPDDVRYFCQAIIVGPGRMVNIPQVDFAIRRVDAYPTVLENAVQHNALWDAYALKTLLEVKGTFDGR